MLVVVVARGLPCGDEAGAHPDAAGSQGERGHQSTTVGDATGGDNRSGGYCVHHLGHQGHGGDAPGVTSALGPLGNDDIGAALGDPAGVTHGADHGYDGHAVAVHLFGVGGGVAQAGGEHRHLLLEHDLDHLLLAGPALGEEEIDRKRFVGEVLHPAHLVAQGSRGEHGGADDPETAGVGDGGYQLGHGDAAHPGLDDGVLDPQPLRELRSKHCSHSSFFARYRPSWWAMVLRCIWEVPSPISISLQSR